MEGLLKPTIHVDEFSSKMGDDDEIIVASFFVRDKSAAKDLMNWFEKGYDFVIDSDMSPGEIKPNRYLVYVAQAESLGWYVKSYDEWLNS